MQQGQKVIIKKTLKEISDFVSGEIVGNEKTVITGINGIKEAGSGDITFLANPRYCSLLDTTKASAVIVSKDITTAPLPIIRTENPSLAFAQVMSMFSPTKTQRPQGIHPKAVISPTAKIAKNTNIGACAIIEDGAQIGQDTIIYPGVYIGYNTKVGDRCLIYPNVSIRENITIGNNVIIHCGTVIGADGFGYATVSGIHHKIPQVGIVIVEDDVEIGANVTIDRARFGKTVIGKGTKIDNLVQIAHNVVVGENSIIVAQTGISGSTTLGKNVTLAGQVGIVGHITIGDNVIVGAQSGVSNSIPPNSVVLGSPPLPIGKTKRIFVCIQNLPELFKTVKLLQNKILGKQSKDDTAEDD